MEIVYAFGIILLAYLLGSIPNGLLVVKLTTGKDVRKVESGRTGGTNVMRAAGLWAGLTTAFLDIVKAALAAWLARYFFPDMLWLHIIAPLAAILGHNYSIFLTERTESGRLRLRGGAGGAPCVGGSVGLWIPSFLIIVPLGAMMLYFVGYASLATLSAALLSTLVFGVRAWMGASPWEYSIYGILAFFLVAWSLRPNIQRLFQGKERLVGFRAKRRKKEESEANSSPN
jgi:glycerol-3-phosphate acyltransferase PlsY